MAVFDKVKDQAKGIRGKVEEKVEDIQGKRRSADMLEGLGRFLYAERTGRPIAGADAEIARLVGELQKLEADGVTII